MPKTKIELLAVWNNVFHIPGWLRLLEMTKEYDQEDIKEFEQIGEEAIGIEKDAERYYRMIEIPRIRIEINEFKEEFSKEFRTKKRLEYLDPFITSLEKRISKIWKKYQDAVTRDIPYWWRSVIRELQDPGKLEKELRSAKVEKYLLENPEVLKRIDRVSPEEIARALTFPFDQLIQFNQAGFTSCPFHNEKRFSFHWIKETNRAYCFGCHWKGDAIQFLRDRDGLNFKEAVRSLCR